MKTVRFTLIITMLLLSMNFSFAQSEHKKSVDFAILDIKSEKCICELEGINAFYMNKVFVLIENRGRETEDAEVKILLSELTPRNTHNVVFKAEKLKPGEKRWVTVIDRPLIVVKTLGVTARIYPLFPNFAEDSERSNNKHVIFDCFRKQ